ncbi:AbrB/MazE/SpoVT family DNA-binding domain-containing protein [Patescibacteria group bacterium]|nr:AbrB/MazE/SpoVT family DNA-binding domain-containing protein [Patescibacteria group bacterium]
MNLGIISTPNTKGQIVIPKKYRDKLKINPDTLLNILYQNEGIFIQPLKKLFVSTDQNKQESFLDILEKTQGIWSGENWDKWEKKQKKRRKLELKASQKRKNQTW